MKKIDRIKEKHITNQGYEIEIIEYFNHKNITIKFNDGTVLNNKQYSHIKNGQINNPNHKFYYNVGFQGIGQHKMSINGKNTKSYNIWNDMMRRCYDIDYQLKKRSYIGCSVDPKWHNFQVFAEWFKNNYVDNWQLDKDILIKGNKVYGPDTCCFVPQEINLAFVRHVKKDEKHLKNLANKYKDNLHIDTYNSIYNYNIN